MKKLIIIGDSAFAEIAFEYFKHDSDYEPFAFAVESEFRTKSELFDLPVVDLETLEQIYPPSSFSIFVAITYTKLNTLRARLLNTLKSRGYQPASYISSNAFVWKNVSVGENCFIFEDNTVQPFVSIEDNTILWSGNHIGHHSIIRKNCFISSHVCVAGFCEVGDNSFLGVNATVANDVRIGAFNWVGADVSIMKSTEENQFWSPIKMKPRDVTAKEYFGVNE